jgi:translation initiation factor IF-3
VDEIKQVMQSVLDTIREAGGTQTKAMEGEPGKQLSLTVMKNSAIQPPGFGIDAMF